MVKNMNEREFILASTFSDLITEEFRILSSSDRQIDETITSEN